MSGALIAVTLCAVLASSGRPAREDSTMLAAPKSLVALINSSAPTDDLFSSVFCGGVLVAPDRVVTARHCLSDRQPADIAVVVGADNICEGGPIAGERVAVRRIVRDSDADRAVVVLSHQVAAPPAEVVETVPTRSDLVAFGWGRRSATEPYPCRPKAIPLRMLEPRRCAMAMDTAKGSLAQQSIPVADQWCAVGTGDLNTCVGDSGGPAFSRLGGTPLLVGVTSWGEGCRPDDPGFYTVVATVGP